MSITTGLPGSVIQAFSWMLIHSVWQGLLLFILTAKSKCGAKVQPGADALFGLPVDYYQYLCLRV